MPGILSARWAGRHGDDTANLQLVLNQCKDIPAERRGAQFVAVVAYVAHDGREITTRGEMRGHLIDATRGDHGFGYDPIFVADGETATNAELTPERKDALSHRGKALAHLISLLAG
jgi:XTP/dITP diphosphohydrolase